MSTLFRYFLSVYLANFLRVMTGLAVVTMLIDMVELARRTSSVTDFSIIDMAGLAALRTPSFLQTIVPFVVLFAAMMTLLNLNKRQELVITRASGMSAWQFIAPLCIGSLLLGLVTMTILSPIASITLAKSEDVQIQIGTKAPRTTDFPPWLRQQTPDGALIIGAEQASSGGTLLGRPSFFLFDSDDNPIQRIDAQTAQLVDGNWVLQNVIIYGQNGQAEKLPSFSIPSSVDTELLGQTLTPPETISFYKLSEAMKTARGLGFPDSPYAMRWHSLFALPALLVAMTLIAATVSLRFARFGQSSSAILGGILSGFLLYVVTAMAEALGSGGVIAPIFAAWLPVVAASFFGVTFLLYREDG